MLLFKPFKFLVKSFFRTPHFKFTIIFLIIALTSYVPWYRASIYEMISCSFHYSLISCGIIPMTIIPLYFLHNQFQRSGLTLSLGNRRNFAFSFVISSILISFSMSLIYITLTLIEGTIINGSIYAWGDIKKHMAMETFSQIMVVATRLACSLGLFLTICSIIFIIISIISKKPIFAMIITMFIPAIEYGIELSSGNQIFMKYAFPLEWTLHQTGFDFMHSMLVLMGIILGLMGFMVLAVYRQDFIGTGKVEDETD